jgi:hypothetical protein
LEFLTNEVPVSVIYNIFRGFNIYINLVGS